MIGNYYGSPIKQRLSDGGLNIETTWSESVAVHFEGKDGTSNGKLMAATRSLQDALRCVGVGGDAMHSNRTIAHFKMVNHF